MTQPTDAEAVAAAMFAGESAAHARASAHESETHGAGNTPALPEGTPAHD